MDKLDEYWANAARALNKSQIVSDAEDRKILRRIGKAWLDLADGRPVILGPDLQPPDVPNKPYSERN